MSGFPNSSTSKHSEFCHEYQSQLCLVDVSKMFQVPVFQQPQIFHQAMTHTSYVNEHPAQSHNERLEFLGDAVLTFLSGEFLYQQYPNESEGVLTSLRAALVDAQQLAMFAQMLNLGQYLRLGKGEERIGGRQNPKLLSSAFEALIGAYFLDSGSDMSVLRTYLLPFFHLAVENGLQAKAEMNAKGRLQEWAQVEFGEAPKYYTIAEIGPDHTKQFTVEVRVAGKVYGQGSGGKKQEAEKQAALKALASLGLLS